MDIKTLEVSLDEAKRRELQAIYQYNAVRYHAENTKWKAENLVSQNEAWLAEATACREKVTRQVEETKKTFEVISGELEKTTRKIAEKRLEIIRIHDHEGQKSGVPYGNSLGKPQAELKALEGEAENLRRHKNGVKAELDHAEAELKKACDQESAAGAQVEAAKRKQAEVIAKATANLNEAKQTREQYTAVVFACESALNDARKELTDYSKK